MRNYAPSPNYHVRAYAWSKDDGMTWTKVRFDKTLIEPICQASVIRFTGKDKHDKNRIIFSNPASQEERVKMTIRLSYDECKTWPVSKLLNKGPSAYSDLAVAPNMTLCCLYERGEMSPYEKITFANFNIEWLSKGADQLNLTN
jgi:sialidase-1